MLAKLEDVYLNILRIAVLAIATIALVVFVLTAAQTGPLIGQFFGLTPKTQVEDASFAEFVATNRPSTGSSSGNYSTPATGSAYPEEIRNAATNLVTYINRHHGFELQHSDMVAFVGGIYDGMAANYQRDYAKSIETFTTQLVNSTGTPISTNQIDRAIQWHAQKFEDAASQTEVTAAANRAKAILAISVAGISLVTFLIIIFLFVVVKIERNLRLVKVNNLSAGA